ncbi:ficolin-2 [Ceratitis capitata]|uniref:ficolin-2 n=1 Tax=Ceratitis capitata TaxID=7213 RepID=UPI000329F196|nr:ficolin-2 [Ceratitis capitata]
MNWLYLASLAVALVYFAASAKAFTSGLTPAKEDNGGIKSNGDAFSNFLCGNNFEKCYGKKLSSAVYARDNKLYKMEVYDLRFPETTLEDIVNEEKNLKSTLNQLEEKLGDKSATAEIYRTELELRTQGLEHKMNENSMNLKSDFAKNMDQLKTSLRSALKTKLNQILQKNDNPSHVDVYADLPTTCAEAFDKYETTESGVYTLYLPHTELAPFTVYCLADPDGGPAWTVVQRRTDGTEDFYLDWDNYVAGFGDKENEFFIGLDKLHALTNAQPNELWIQMEDFEDEQRFAKYTDFGIGDHNVNYKLNKLDGFTGDAGDSLSVQKGREFSTRDRDNDNDPTKSCAVTYTGAWWYNRCHDSNLNGRYLDGEYDYDDDAQGIDWYTWHGHQYSLKYVHMAIRPKFALR